MNNTRKDNIVKRFLANLAAKMRQYNRDYEEMRSYRIKTFEAAWL